MKEYLSESQKLEFENLKKTKISELTPEEVEDRIKTLAFVTSFDVVVCYMLYVLDMEYILSDKTEDNMAAESFLADERLEKYREAVYKHIDVEYFDEIAEIENDEINSNE